MGSLLNKHEGDSDSDDDTESKSGRGNWPNARKYNSRTTNDTDDSTRLRRQVSRYKVIKHYSKSPGRAKRLRRQKLPPKRRYITRYPSPQKRPAKRYRSKRPAKRYRSKRPSKHTKTRRAVGSRRKRKGSESKHRRIGKKRVAKSGRGEPKRKRGRPRKNSNSRVNRKKVSKNSMEAKRDREETESNRRSDTMREVSTRQDVDRMFKPPDKVKRKGLEKGIDDIQENPLSVRKRCNSLVKNIPGIPFDGRKRNKKRSHNSRNKLTKRDSRGRYSRKSDKTRKKRTKRDGRGRYSRKSDKTRKKRTKKDGRGRYSRRRSGSRRKYRKPVKRRYRRSRTYGNRNGNAIEPLPILPDQVLHWQPGVDGNCRPKVTKRQSISSRHESRQRICHTFACLYSRRGVATSRSFISCNCYCRRIPHFGIRRGEAVDISPGSCPCCKLKKLSTKTRAVKNLERRKTKRKSNTDFKSEN